jgi:uncharacterized protein involved in outer membrane biogenesis
MKRNTRNAFNKLKAIGAPVFENDAEFGLSAEDNAPSKATDKLEADAGVLFLAWADYYQEAVRERVNDAGDIINAFGVWQPVLDILNAHGLWAEWANPGALNIYEA